MSQPIDAAPKDGSTILIEDDASGAHDVARWSPEAGTWIDKNGEPSKITASHWLPIPSETWSKASSAPDQVQRRGSRGRFTILAIAFVVVACFAAGPSGYEISAFLTRQPRLHDASEGEDRLTQPTILEPQFKAGQPGTATLASDARPTQMAATALPSDAHQSPQVDDQSRRALDAERERSAALANELELMRREVEARAAQLRRVINDAKLQEQAAAGTISAMRQSLQQERDKMAALQKETSAIRQAMLADDEQHRRALDEERVRRAALLSELAGAQREVETQAAQLRKATETMQLRQAEVTESATLLKQEREKTTALAREVEDARQRLNTSTAQGQGSFAEAPLDTEMEPKQSKASVETRQPEEAEAGASARLLEEKRERTATLAQEVTDAPQELKHQPLKPAREQRSSSLPRNPPKLNRGQSAKQSWRPLLWLWGLDPRWQRTMHVSVFGRRSYR